MDRTAPTALLLSVLGLLIAGAMLHSLGGGSAGDMLWLAAGALAAAISLWHTVVNLIPDPAPGTVRVAQTTCPVGQILLSGGGQVPASGPETRNVVLKESFP